MDQCRGVTIRQVSSLQEGNQRKKNKGVNWDEESEDLNGMWEVMRDKRERNVPKMESNMSKKSKPIWMTYKALTAVKTKHNSWKRYTRGKQHYDVEDVKRKRNHATKERSQESKYEV